MIQQELWSKANLIVPINGEGVETETEEILLVLQFRADSFLS